MITLLEEFGGNALIKNDDGLNCIDICEVDKNISTVNHYKSLNKYTAHFSKKYQWKKKKYNVKFFFLNIN